MLPTLTIFLFAAILIIVAVLCLMFFSVAFAGPQTATASATAEKLKAPVDDDALVRWATRMAASVTTNRLSKDRSSRTATALAQELYASTAEALEQLREEESQCPARCHEMIGVTAPEVLAVADNVRTRLNETEVDHIRSAAKTNMVQTEEMDRKEYAVANVTCPLLTNDGTCAAYPLRPLFCRTDCAVCGSDDSSEPPRRVSSSSLAIGIGRGLSKSLAAVGVDANRYELNSALLVALSARDVSERWASGDRVFADCKQFVL